MSRLVKGSRRWWGPVVLTGVVLVLLLLVRAAPSRGPEEPALSPLSPLPTPTPAEVVITPTAVFEEATPTPWPTLTPRPTPTRRPGPTATPFPTRGPVPDPSGMILYLSAEQGTVMGVPVDREGRKAGEVAPLPLRLDFVPVLEPPSPDGRYLLLRRPVEPAGIPYVFDRKTQELWPLLKGHPMQPYIIGRVFGWHPNNRQVLFWMYNNEELWLIDVETSEYTVLALNEGPVQGATISPDGQKIVYADRYGVNKVIWIVSAGGSDARPLYKPIGLTYVFDWSPDGTYILFIDGSSPYSKDPPIGDAPAPGGPLWLMDPEGQNRRPLVGHFLFGWGFQPVWSPDGQWVAFTGPEPDKSFGCAQKPPYPDAVTCRLEGTAIYIENIRSGEVRRLASGIEPVWSPDGSMLAFLSNQSGVIAIWTIQTDGDKLQQIITDVMIAPIFWITKER